MSGLERLNALVGEVMDLKHAADLIEWDERVYMPPGGATTHGEMQATLRSLAHGKFTDVEIGRLLDRLRRDIEHADPDADSTRLVRVASRD